MRITKQMLEAKGACADQVALFATLFPGGVDVIVAACVAVADKFDWDWAARNLLPATAWAEYKRVTAPAWAEYDRVTAPAWAEYARVAATEYDHVVAATAGAEYERVTATAWATLAMSLDEAASTGSG